MVFAIESDQPGDVALVYDQDDGTDDDFNSPEDKERKELERVSSAVAAAPTGDDDDADADEDDVDLDESADLATTRPAEPEPVHRRSSRLKAS